MRYSVGMFRQHAELTIGIENRTLRHLCFEWVELNRSPDTAATLRQWAAHHPVLAGLESPGAIVDSIDTHDHAGKSAVMGALLELVGDHSLAGRILLQAMLPCLTGLAQRHSSPCDITSHEERLHRTISEFWGVVARGPRNPGTRIAAGLKYDTLRALTSHRRDRHDPWETSTCYVEDMHPEFLETPANDSVTGIYELVLTARATGVLTAGQAQLLSDVYLSPIPETELAQAAHRLGVQEPTLRKRISRIKATLREAVLAGRVDEATTPVALVS